MLCFSNAEVRRVWFFTSSTVSNALEISCVFLWTLGAQATWDMRLITSQTSMFANALSNCKPYQQFRGPSDFLYFPMDFESARNMGFVFVSFRGVIAGKRIEKRFHCVEGLASAVPRCAKLARTGVLLLIASSVFSRVSRLRRHCCSCLVVYWGTFAAINDDVSELVARSRVASVAEIVAIGRRISAKNSPSGRPHWSGSFRF